MSACTKAAGQGRWLRLDPGLRERAPVPLCLAARRWRRSAPSVSREAASQLLSQGKATNPLAALRLPLRRWLSRAPGRACARTVRRRRPCAPPRSPPAPRPRPRCAGGRARAPGRRQAGVPRPGLRLGLKTAVAPRRAAAQGPRQACCGCCSTAAPGTAAGCLSAPGARHAAARQRPRPPEPRSWGSGHQKCPQPALRRKPGRCKARCGSPAAAATWPCRSAPRIQTVGTHRLACE